MPAIPHIYAKLRIVNAHHREMGIRETLKNKLAVGSTALGGTYTQCFIFTLKVHEVFRNCTRIFTAIISLVR
jgi:hypothetical protein